VLEYWRAAIFTMEIFYMYKEKAHEFYVACYLSR
jgi:hypothetical protein